MKVSATYIKLFVKNMVSIRCRMIVIATMKNLRLPYVSVRLGEIKMAEELSAPDRSQLKAALLPFGLELLDDKNAMMIEKIKRVIVEMIHYEDEMPLTNSEYISTKMKLNYAEVAKIFVEGTSTTIENQIIHHKIERVKELLLYNTLSLTAIAYKLRYSSAAHLSAQFKKETGLTPSFFRKMKHNRQDGTDPTQ